MKSQKFKLKLKGKTLVMIDWSNVYHWKEKLKQEVDLTKLVRYVKTYPEVGEVRFYFGTEDKPFSKLQLKEARGVGCKVVTKPVKFLVKEAETGEMVRVRKCDFDLEMGLDTFERLDKYDGFLFFSGDGDFATLYERLVRRKKQVIVIFAKGSLGREIWQMRGGIFIKPISGLGVDLYKKISPRQRRGARWIDNKGSKIKSQLKIHPRQRRGA